MRIGPIEFAGLGCDGAGLQGALFDGRHRRDLAVISGGENFVGIKQVLPVQAALMNFDASIGQR